MVLGKLDRYMQKNETRPPSYTIHKRITSKWIKDLNGRPKPIKNVEENIGSKISNIAQSNILSDISPQARETKKNKQMGLHQTKKCLHSKGYHQLTEWENIFSITSGKVLISKVYKELTKLNT